MSLDTPSRLDRGSFNSLPVGSSPPDEQNLLSSVAKGISGNEMSRSIIIIAREVWIIITLLELTEGQIKLLLHFDGLNCEGSVLELHLLQLC